MTRWSVSPRIFRSATRLSTDRGISAISTAITRRRCATPSRLSAVAQAMLDGIDEDAVDFRATYDGEDSEPVVLPARFPNLLANGASGIAVGMATSIPPHNAGELCAALLQLIDHPACADRRIARAHPRSGFPDRRRSGRARREHRRPMRPAAAALPARALGEGAAGPRPLPDRRHRDAVPGAEGTAVEKSRPCSKRRNCRSSPISVTNRPRMSASCSSRRPATSRPRC